MSRPVVLHIGKFYPPHMGGIETHLETLCARLPARFDVRVLASNHMPGLQAEVRAGIPVTRLPTPFSITSAPVNPGMPAAIRAERPDLVHIHLPHPGGVLGLLGSGYRGPIVVTYHSDVVRQRAMSAVFSPFLNRLLGRARAIVASSARYVDSSNVLQRYRHLCRVIPYGIPEHWPSGREDARCAEIRAQFGPRIVLCVGRFVYYKGIAFAVRAMRGLNARLLIIGDGPLRKHVEREVRRCGVESRVALLGRVECVAPFFSAADVFVLPSIARSEAFGIVQLEAMSAGTPVVNTRVDSGVPWVSQDGVTGLTVTPADPAALATAIGTLLDDERLRARLGAAGRERVRREFTAEVMARRVAEIYDEVLA